MIDLQTAEQQIVSAGRRLYAQGLMPGESGNLSIRTEDGILLTPGGFCKGRLEPNDLVLVGMDGEISGDGWPTSELPMHLTIYRERPEIEAVVHVHAPYAVALTVAGHSFDDGLLPEIGLKFGRVPVTDFAQPSTPRSAEVILPHLREGITAAILPFHGIVALGETLECAIMTVKTVEYAAKVQVLAQLIGFSKPNPKEDK